MKKIAFVILHYNNIDDTYNCINSIRKLKLNSNVELKMIIVDNCSPDKSGKELQKKYENDNDIEVMLLEKNLGFSKGNNIGYEEALKMNPDSIMVINNDIIFEDDEFILNYLEYKKNNNKDIIAPNIIDINNRHQNPLSIYPPNVQHEKRNLIKLRIYYALLMIPIINYIAMWIYTNHEAKWYEKNYSKILMNDKSFNKDDFVPFGAFIIFANNWLKNETKAFYSDTFMYGEESILYNYLKKKKYTIGFCEKLKVRHICGSSTNKVSKSEIKKSKFKIKNSIIAYQEIIKCMNGSENK